MVCQGSPRSPPGGQACPVTWVAPGRPGRKCLLSWAGEVIEEVEGAARVHSCFYKGLETTRSFLACHSRWVMQVSALGAWTLGESEVSDPSILSSGPRRLPGRTLSPEDEGNVWCAVGAWEMLVDFPWTVSPPQSIHLI